MKDTDKTQSRRCERQQSYPRFTTRSYSVTCRNDENVRLLLQLWESSPPDPRDQARLSDLFSICYSDYRFDELKQFTSEDLCKIAELSWPEPIDLECKHPRFSWNPAEVHSGTTELPQPEIARIARVHPYELLRPDWATQSVLIPINRTIQRFLETEPSMIGMKLYLSKKGSTSCYSLELDIPAEGYLYLMALEGKQDSYPKLLVPNIHGNSKIWHVKGPTSVVLDDNEEFGGTALNSLKKIGNGKLVAFQLSQPFDRFSSNPNGVSIQVDLVGRVQTRVYVDAAVWELIDQQMVACGKLDFSFIEVGGLYETKTKKAGSGNRAL